MKASAKQVERKTNAQRKVEAAGVPFTFHSYDPKQGVSGVDVARSLGQDPYCVFKTLVTQGKSGEYYVFMVPVACELDLKKAAAVVGEKSVQMIRARELFPLTGYVHGGCSPLGMKKRFRTFADESAALHDRIMFSGGRIGVQIELTASDLADLADVEFADLTAR